MKKGKKIINVKNQLHKINKLLIETIRITPLTAFYQMKKSTHENRNTQNIKAEHEYREANWLMTHSELSLCKPND